MCVFSSDTSSLIWHLCRGWEKKKPFLLRAKFLKIEAVPKHKVHSAKEKKKEPRLQTWTPESSSEPTTGTSRSDCCSQANHYNESPPLLHHAQHWDSSSDNRLKGSDCGVMQYFCCGTRWESQFIACLCYVGIGENSLKNVLTDCFIFYIHVQECKWMKWWNNWLALRLLQSVNLALIKETFRRTKNW